MNSKIILLGLFCLLFGSIQAQDLTPYQNQLESTLKNLGLTPKWTENKESLTVNYDGNNYTVTIYANRLNQKDDYTIFLSFQSKTGVKASYLDGIYAINKACTKYYTAKGYLDNFAPDRATNNQLYEIVTSADILMAKSTSLNAKSLKWTLTVMKNFSNVIKEELQ